MLISCISHCSRNHCLLIVTKPCTPLFSEINPSKLCETMGSTWVTKVCKLRQQNWGSKMAGSKFVVASQFLAWGFTKCIKRVTATVLVITHSYQVLTILNASKCRSPCIYSNDSPKILWIFFTLFSVLLHIWASDYLAISPSYLSLPILKHIVDEQRHVTA